MSDKVDYHLEIGRERILRGTIVLPPRDRWPSPVVLFCHGFKGFKDWGAWPWLSHRLAERGFLVNRFNFSLSGVGESLDKHDEPRKFERNTYGTEIEDLSLLLEQRDRWGIPPGSSGSGVALVGHSRGGLVSLLFSAEDDRIQSVVTLGSPAWADRFDDTQKTAWRDRGFMEFPNQRTGQILQLDTSVLDDLELNRDRYDFARAVASRSIPTLVIHGAEDESVPVAESNVIFDAIPHERKKLVQIPGTGHTFGTSHPFVEPTAAIGEVKDEILAWLEETLPR